MHCPTQSLLCAELLMTQSLSGRYDGVAIIPDQPLDLPAGQRLTITIESIDPAPRLSNLPPELERRNDGSIVVVGQRISLFLLLEFFRQGLTPSAIRQRLPTVSEETVTAIRRFCQQNDDAVQAFYQQQ